MTEQSHAYLQSAIAAANGLRVELGRALSGPLTVSPHSGLLGGVVAIYVGDQQAKHLADIVRRGGLGDPDAATKYTFGDFGDPTVTDHHWIDVEARPGFEGIRWSIMCSGWAYTHDGTWIHEPIPGERTGAYLAATRWNDRKEAIELARKLIAEGHPNTLAWTKGRRYP